MQGLITSRGDQPHFYRFTMRQEIRLELTLVDMRPPAVEGSYRQGELVTAEPSTSVPGSQQSQQPNGPIGSLLCLVARAENLPQVPR